MVKPVLTIQDERLYKVSAPVTKFDRELRDLVRDMFDSMAEEGGVGLAAVQIGILKRVLVIDLVEKGFIKGDELQVKAGEIVAWLKEDFDLGHGHAMAIYATFKGKKE